MKKFEYCKNCSLFDNPIVHGQKGIRKDVIFIGEAPGWNEVKENRPFVGRAGKLLEEILNELGLNKGDFHISNSCICRPTNLNGGNRTPTREEIICCNNRLLKAIKKINPKVVIALGAVAYYALVVDNTFPLSVVKMKEIVGREFKSKNGYKVLVTYHPAYALRNKEYKEIIKRHILEVFDK